MLYDGIVEENENIKNNSPHNRGSIQKRKNPDDIATNFILDVTNDEKNDYEDSDENSDDENEIGITSNMDVFLSKFGEKQR